MKIHSAIFLLLTSAMLAAPPEETVNLADFTRVKIKIAGKWQNVGDIGTVWRQHPELRSTITQDLVARANSMPAASAHTLIAELNFWGLRLPDAEAKKVELRYSALPKFTPSPAP